MNSIAWQFKTARFTVSLLLSEDPDYQYDGDDEDGETQRKLDSGEYVAFDSQVTVALDGHVIARDTLGGSVYGANAWKDFFTDHRTSSAEYRNTLAQKAQSRVICHYFPDMVRQAIREARDALCNVPKIRCA